MQFTVAMAFTLFYPLKLWIYQSSIIIEAKWDHDDISENSDATSKIREVSVLSFTSSNQYFDNDDMKLGIICFMNYFRPTNIKSSSMNYRGG